MKIVIDFDDIAKEVISITIDDKVSPLKPVKGKKQINEKLQLTLESNKLILSSKLVELLQVKEGDRLVVRYKDDGGFIQPFLAPAKIFSEEGGNKLTKTSTVSFRGDQQISLARFGNIFEIEDMKDGSVKLVVTNKVQESLPKMSQETLDIIAVIGDDNTSLVPANFIIN